VRRKYPRCIRTEGAGSKVSPDIGSAAHR
jgi:hypothetical protein